MGKLNALAVCACLLSGCVSAAAEGTMLSDNTALISATGELDQRAEMIDRALKEAATVTSMHGYRYFVILTADDTSSTTSVAVPGQRLVFQMLTNRSFGATTFGAAAYPGGTYTQSDRRVTRIKPGLDIIIQMYRNGEIHPQKQGVWNADVVLGRIASVE